MKITYSHIEVVARNFIEDESKHSIGKLNRLLKKYSPDLVLLHGSLEKSPHKNEYSYSLNLTLPTGTLHATGIGTDIRKSVKAAFAEIGAQVKKHQEKLRRENTWQRKRSRVLPMPDGAALTS
jgi:ribosome-associated translation inhibitor RaiA